MSASAGLGQLTTDNAVADYAGLMSSLRTNLSAAR